jgi:hypothetical protein
MRGVKKENLPEKVCPACRRPFAGRKKWARDWASVKYGSDACRRAAAAVMESRLDWLPKVVSEKVGDALPGVAANPQVCPTISEITFGNSYSRARAGN